MVYEMEKEDVSIVGDLCNLDLLFAEHLSRVGLRFFQKSLHSIISVIL